MASVLSQEISTFRVSARRCYSRQSLAWNIWQVVLMTLFVPKGLGWLKGRFMTQVGAVMSRWIPALVLPESVRSSVSLPYLITMMWLPSSWAEICSPLQFFFKKFLKKFRNTKSTDFMHHNSDNHTCSPSVFLHSFLSRFHFIFAVLYRACVCGTRREIQKEDNHIVLVTELRSVLSIVFCTFPQNTAYAFMEMICPFTEMPILGPSGTRNSCLVSSREVSFNLPFVPHLCSFCFAYITPGRGWKHRKERWKLWMQNQATLQSGRTEQKATHSGFIPIPLFIRKNGAESVFSNIILEGCYRLASLQWQGFDFLFYGNQKFLKEV